MPCWIETHKKMEWRGSLHTQRQDGQKAATWNPGVSIGCRATRAVGRPRKRWEDDINQFLKLEETQEKCEEQRHMDMGGKRPKHKEK